LKPASTKNNFHPPIIRKKENLISQTRCTNIVLEHYLNYITYSLSNRNLPTQVTHGFSAKWIIKNIIKNFLNGFANIKINDTFALLQTKNLLKI